MNLNRLRQLPVLGWFIHAGWAGLRALWHRLGRPIAIRRYLSATKRPCLHIGASSPEPAGWLNTDLLPTRFDVVRLDATKRFPLPDEVFHFVFSEHMIEHIARSSAQLMLVECHRVLRPGGWIRIATPDLRQVTRLRADPQAEEVKGYLQAMAPRYAEEANDTLAAVVVNDLFYGHGHRFLYDAETLSSALRHAGFEEIRRCQPGESTLPELHNIERHQEVIGTEPNRYETLVLEARKPAVACRSTAPAALS